MGKHIDFVFEETEDGQKMVFIEAENDGKSVRIGKWIKRPDGYHALRISEEDIDQLP